MNFPRFEPPARQETEKFLATNEVKLVTDG